MRSSQPDIIFSSMSAFAAYLRGLRRGNEMRQQAVCEGLRDFGLRPNVKDIYEWENGVRLPSSLARAAVIRVLDGSALQADDLLLRDADTKTAIAAALHAGDQLKAHQLATENNAYGAEQARIWLYQQRTSPSNSHGETGSHPSAHVPQLVDALLAYHPKLVEDLLRFGRFLLYEARDQSL